MVQISQLDDEDYTAIYAYVNGFGKYGDPKQDCRACKSERMKERLGCGFVEKYKGKAKWKEPYNGTCPAYFRLSRFMFSVLKYLSFKGNLDPFRTDNRLVEAINTYESLEVERANRKLRAEAEKK